MTFKETIKLIKAMKSAGVKSYKDGDVELSFEDASPQTMKLIDAMNDVICEPLTPIDAPTTEEDPIKHKVEEMVSLMKLNDNELVDRLFPDTQEQEESA